MLLKELMIFDLLSTPVWVVHPFKEAVVYCNQASRTLSGAMSLDEMRKGTLSSCPERSLQNYLYYFKNIAEVFEVWTIQTPEGLSPVYCKTTLIKSAEYDTLILLKRQRSCSKMTRLRRSPRTLTNGAAIVSFRDSL